jgi:hypothetical protein
MGSLTSVVQYIKIGKIGIEVPELYLKCQVGP